MAEEKKDDAAAESEPAAPKGPKIILGMTIPVLAFVVLNALVMLGGLGYIVFVSLIYKPRPILEEQVVAEVTKKMEKGAAGSLDSGNFLILEMEEMTINLKVAEGTKSHYATIEPAIECSNQACLDLVKQFKARIEDLIQGKFSAKSFTELNAIETRFRVRHEIIQEINTFINEGAVTNIYFNSFVVQ